MFRYIRQHECLIQHLEFSNGWVLSIRQCEPVKIWAGGHFHTAETVDCACWAKADDGKPVGQLRWLDTHTGTQTAEAGERKGLSVDDLGLVMCLIRHAEPPQ
jgi:hypothetical protein